MDPEYTEACPYGAGWDAIHNEESQVHHTGPPLIGWISIRSNVRGQFFIGNHGCPTESEWQNFG